MKGRRLIPVELSDVDVRALLAGRKTRLILPFVPQPTRSGTRSGGLDAAPGRPAWIWRSPKLDAGYCHTDEDSVLWLAEIVSPMQAGRRLYVKEAWAPVERPSDHVDGIRYRADRAFIPIRNTLKAADAWGQAAANDHSGHARPAATMPRWAARVLLEVTAMRAVRMRSIHRSEDSELGIPCPRHDGQCSCPALRRAIIAEWDRHEGAGSWASNPFVYVVQARRERLALPPILLRDKECS